MTVDDLAEVVIQQARAVFPDYSAIELVGISDGVAHIRFSRDRRPECLECALSPDDFRTLLLALFAQNAPHIVDVHLEEVQ